MTDDVRADICVIGAGSGGLSVAAGASQMGASVVLIERARMGGDCLNHGCVPSKSLLAAAHRAHLAATWAPFGLVGGAPTIDFGAVQAHVADVIQQIAPHDSPERFAALGVRVIRESATFVAPDTVRAGTFQVRAKRFVIATGSRPMVPPIPGLDRVPYLTNETVFENRVCPAHLIVVGGGPIGTEMAQAHRRLGARVTVVEMSRVLAKDDPELSEVVVRALAREGIELLPETRVESIAVAPGGVRVATVTPAGPRIVEGSHLLLAAGRAANVAGLGLEAAGIVFGPRGVQVDARLRTTNRRVYAIGDVAGPYQFTHMAAYQAGVVIRNMLFRLPAKVDYRAVPWVTFTDPELAQVGLSEAAARARHGDNIRVLRWPYADNDRARAERATDGLIKVIVSPRGRVLGAGIVGAHAGELIQPWCLMIARNLPIAAMASMIAPYPTLAEIGKRAAGSFFTPTLFGERTRRLVRFLLRFP